MNLLQILRRINEKVFYKINPVRKGSPAVQEAFLERFPSPRDDWERSYFQYRCQAFLNGRILTFLMNCAAVVLLPVYHLYLRGKKPVSTQSCDAVMLASTPRDLIPQSLEEKYNITQIPDFQNHFQLSKDDAAYLRLLFRRYPFAFYFRFKCMVKVAMYSAAITRCQPKAIICSEEYSFTSSLLTDYCQRHHVKHINYQHGVKMIFIREAFFHFDQCYFWDQYSVDLMKLLHAEPGQFIVERPPSLSLEGMTTELERVDYTYYLQVPTPAELERIKNSLTVLRARGAKIAVRPHPLHIDMVKSLYQDSSGFLLEDPREVPIKQSLLRTNCAISPSSAVLIQAAYNDIPIVIDDIFAPGIYENLCERKYLCVMLQHRRLSELLRPGEGTSPEREPV